MSYTFLGKWDSSGRPEYLMEDDEVNPVQLASIRKSLPERQPVPTYNSQYLNENIITSLNITNDGTEIEAVFLDEGAGYLNSFGYYIYDANTTLKYEDRLKLSKTIVFPNCSLPGSGGNLRPGNRVKLLYDGKTTFPAGVKVGFFLVPDGWNSSTKTVKTNNDCVHSDDALNKSGKRQVILLYDNQATDESITEIVLGMEDIMIANGNSDQDFNDLVIKLKINSPKSVDLSSLNYVKSINAPTTVDLCVDKTGVYISLPDSVYTNLVNKYKGKGDKEIKLEQKIYYKDDETYELSKKVFEDVEWEYGCGVSHDDKDKSHTISGKFKSNELKQYCYLMKSINNKEKQSRIGDVKRRNIIEYQNLYILNKNRINNQYVKLCDNDTDETLVTTTTFPDLSLNIAPLVLGDPYIKTIYGDRYKLPDEEAIYTLYQNENLELRASVEKYSGNDEHPIHSKLMFLRKVSINYDGKQEVFDIFDLENDNNDNHEHFKFVNAPETRYNLYENAIVKYVEIKTSILGNIYLELIFLPTIGDHISELNVINKNILLQKAKGILVSPFNIKKCVSLF